MILHKDCKLSHLNFVENMDATALCVYDNSCATIEDCIFQSNDFESICINKKSSAHIINCDFSKNKGIAVVTQGEATVFFENCNFEKNNYECCKLSHQSSCSFYKCNFYNNKRPVIHTQSDTSITLKKSKFYKNIGKCIYAKGKSKVSLEECTIFNNLHTCIETICNSYISAKNCEFYDNDNKAICTGGKSEGFYFRCNFHEFNKSACVECTSNSAPFFEECNIYNNKIAGFYVKDTANPVVSNCLFGNNEGVGIIVDSCAKGNYKHCEFFQNSESCFFALGNASPSVTQFDIHNHKNCFEYSHPIEIMGQSKGEYSSCRFHDLKSETEDEYEVSCFYIEQDASPKIKCCSFFDNSDIYGITIQDKARGEFEKLSFFNNRGFVPCIEASGSAFIKVLDSNVYDNKVPAFVISENASGLLSKTKVLRNESGTECIMIEDSAHICMYDCQVCDNKSIGIVLRDKVKGHCYKCEFRNNKHNISSQTSNYSFFDCINFPSTYKGIKLYSSPITLDDLITKNEDLVGDYFLFGLWPQTLKKEYVTVDESVKYRINAWICYPADDGNLYIKAIDKNDHKSKYFKMEHIKWRVISYNFQHKILLLSEDILFASCFYPNVRIRVLDGKEVYPNNYEYSKIRAYLNGLNGSSYNVKYFRNIDFFTSTFSEAAKDWFDTLKIDNSLITEASLYGDKEVPIDYCCNDTRDKAFLLSVREVTRTKNGGFINAYHKECKARMKKATDFAKAMGAEDKWMLRSPAPGNGNEIYYVNSLGYVDSITDIQDESVGIAVAVTINLL